MHADQKIACEDPVRSLTEQRKSEFGLLVDAKSERLAINSSYKTVISVSRCHDRLRGGAAVGVPSN
jgi:hypothetical protein